jgi:hypothetical protein
MMDGSRIWRGEHANELETDTLVELMGGYYDRAVDSPVYLDEKLFNWTTQELNATARSDEGWSRGMVTAVARQIWSHAVGARLSVRMVDEHAPMRAAPVGDATIANSLEVALAERCAPWLELAPAAGVGRELWDDVCESWVELPDDIVRGRYVALTVSGDSMLPLVHPGDVILVKLGNTVTRDTVVVAQHAENGYVVKRVGQVRSGSLELCSLNPRWPPITVPRRDDTVLGTVIMRWCTHADAREMSKGSDKRGERDEG